ncbi:TRAP-type C4-dicarboxylate transport system permease small subunit [Rhodobacter aestuarii]|uniref:TRAP transporter small permease protein n=1 Tax=Rhodobacter aestuarii TaxID=453582 RepID=A0A1N7K0S9_9RHOB|nr:TRAP transporter small permease [Rhodobacter aestuarii]PTV95906.1 TRAP-type C4-dicarboxylate transport system permease small subunit [Rhodobacter aestuarii]SIS55190.1 TRAP-type C4-dicarboxylate transport system, small permease component [Rhodobacter aestuarii]
MVRLLELLCLLLRRVISGVVILLFAVMMTSVLVQVAGRYIFNFSIAQASEIATFSQIWLVLLGAGIAVSRSQHVAIDVVPAMLPRAQARLALLAISGISIAFLAVLAYGSLPLIKMGAFQTSPTLRIPMKYMYFCLPAGAAYMALEMVLAVIQRWHDPFPSEQVDPHEEAI